MSNRYEQRGVSAHKEDVHAAIKDLDKGIFPNAFCKVLPDVVGGNAEFCNLMHADTAGTKTSLAYLYWKETGNVNIWKGIVQDAVVMNIDDMGCVGVVDDIMLSSTIGRNKNLINGEVIATIINGCAEFADEMRKHGVNVHLTGGETADVGDIVRTIDVGYTTFARKERSKILENNIQAGDVIVSLASFGQATYESAYNSGIGSNGLTSARHDVLSKYYYENFPESFDPATPADLAFSGSKRLIDTVEGTPYTVGDLLLSPTRSYLPVLKQIFDTIAIEKLHGVIHCSGGAQTKVLHFIDKVHVIKDNLFDTPPVFDLIQKESNTDWKEMYQVFNMGARLEVYTDAETAKAIMAIAASFDIEARISGRVEARQEGKQVTVSSKHGSFIYN